MEKSQIRVMCLMITLSVMTVGIVMFVIFSPSDERGVTDNVNYYEKYSTSEVDSPYLQLRIFEGEWPVKQYSNEVSQVAGITFEYPTGWSWRMYSFTESLVEKDSNHPFDEIKGDVLILLRTEEMKNIYKGSMLPGGLIPEERQSASEITVSGIPGIDYKGGIDSESGKYLRCIILGNESVYIEITIVSYSGRSEEEYDQVVDRFLEALNINFQQWIDMIPK